MLVSLLLVVISYLTGATWRREDFFELTVSEDAVHCGGTGTASSLAPSASTFISPAATDISKQKTQALPRGTFDIQGPAPSHPLLGYILPKDPTSALRTKCLYGRLHIQALSLLESQGLVTNQIIQGLAQVSSSIVTTHNWETSLACGDTFSSHSVPDLRHLHKEKSCNMHRQLWHQ